MHPPVGDTWLIPAGLRDEQLLAALGQIFVVVSQPEYNATVVYADTFDWRLFRQEYLLHNHGHSWTLYHGESCEITLQQGGPDLSVPCFAGDFPPGRLRDILAPLVGPRCLLPLGTVHLQGRQYRLCNADEKTVVRLVIERQRPQGQGAEYWLARLFAVRGYDEPLAQAQLVLASHGVNEAISPLIGFEAACRSGGRAPLDYSSKFSLQLTPEQPSSQAVATIYLQLLETIRRNLPGVGADWDVEFLHDLRVALRRTRSGLSLIKDVLPPRTVARFKKGFAALGALTGPTRDLDVYLLQQAKYRDRLAPSLQPGLDLYFQELARRRRLEQKKLARSLRAKKTAALLADWQRCLQQAQAQPTASSLRPVKALADPIIRRHHKKVLRLGLALEANTPDAEVHRLRIQCKKLRYAIEFFSSLYAKDEIGVVIHHLKALQDILGTFNDLSVQQAMLRQAVESLPGGVRETTAMAAALGGLQQSLFQEQQALRDHFAEAFAQFSDQQTSELCHHLFRQHQEPI